MKEETSNDPKSIFSIASAIVLGCYFIISLTFCIKKRMRVFVNWADYILLNSFLIAYCILTRIGCKTFNKSLVLAALSGLFIMNSIKGIAYIIGVNRLMNLPAGLKDNSEQLTFYFTSNGLTKYISKMHYLFMAIAFTMQIIIAVISYQYFFQSDSAQDLSLIISSSLLVISLGIILIAKQHYSRLLNYNFFSQNLLIEKQFTKSKESALVLIEYLINKNIFDILINFPLIINNYLCLTEKEKSGCEDIAVYYYGPVFLIYIVFYGSMLLTIDKHNSVTIPGLAYYFHFLGFVSFNIISSRKPIQLYNEILSQSFEEDDFRNLHKNSFRIEPLNQEIENESYRTEKEFLPSNFFIIFKLLLLFFKRNEKVYLETEKSVEENGAPFRNFLKRDTKPLLTSSNISEKIIRISRISITNKERIHSTVKYTLNNLMNIMEEKSLKSEFMKYILKDTMSDPEFKIEAEFMDILFELFPFYQISINDVMKSLDIGDNKDLFQFFFETKSNKKHFNSFYTKDLFLSFEVYDQQFIPFNTIKSFVSSYKKYILEKLQSFSYSFLPMIIGIFNVTYLSYNKIVVLYKNPIAFSSCIKNNCWINYCFHNQSTAVQKSAEVNDVADLEEIEVKNNICLGEIDYNEAIKALKADLKFLKSHHFDLSFVLNLFVMNDAKKNQNAFDLTLLSKNSEVPLDKAGSADKLFEGLRDTSLFRDSFDNRAKQMKKYYGSDVVSLVERLYENAIVENIYVFKVYFSELFLNSSSLEYTDSSPELIDKRNKQYCKQ